MTSAPSIPTAALDHRDCVGEAAVSIFSATCGVQLTPTAENDTLCEGGVIIAIISVVGDVEWSIFLGLPRDTAVALAAKFAGFEIPFDSSDMGDAIGELTNILAGEVKNRLHARKLRCEISLPSVIRAESLRVLVQSRANVVKACFASPAGALWTGLTAEKGPGLVA